MSLKTHREIMKFLWIIISATIFLLLRGSHARNSENMKRNSEMFCPKDWRLFGTFCYKGFREGLDFEHAEKDCVKLGGHLAAIRTKEIQDFVTAEVIIPMEHAAYIGLQLNDNTTKYHWLDGSESEFHAWDENEPSGKNLEKSDDEYCVEMGYFGLFHKLESVGRWNDVVCKRTIPYICEKLHDPQTTKPEEEPDHCSSTLDGSRLRKSCYHLSLHHNTWEKAEKYCVEEYDGHLASITDYIVQKFIHYKVATHPTQPTSVWIGLQLQPDEVALWTSGWYMGYTNWIDKKEKYAKISSKSCAFMTRGGYGEWTLGPCDQHQAFICENSTVIPPPKFEPTVPGLKCPSDEWIDLGGDHCYIFNAKTPVSWHHANFFCLRKGGMLASIHSRQDEEVIAQFFRLSTVAVYMGLIRHDRPQQTNSEWEWIDGSPFDYQNWRWGEPNSGNEMCGETVPGLDMTWNDMHCDTARLYACFVAKTKVPGVGAPTFPGSTEEPLSDSKKEECECLPTLAIAGIVFCVLLVIGLLGIVIYNIKPWKKNCQQEHDQKRKSSGTSGKPLFRTRDLVISDRIYENVDEGTN